MYLTKVAEIVIKYLPSVDKYTKILTFTCES
jgi:hypothetical protein